MTTDRRTALEADLLEAMAAVREPADLGAVYTAQGRLAAHAFGPVLDRTELYGVVDGRTGLHLTRDAADTVLEARVRAEVRPWPPGAVYAEAPELADLLDRVRQATGRGLVPVPSEQPPQDQIHGGHGTASPPPPSPRSCGRDGRHTAPAGPGVTTCPCGLVTRVPAP